MTRNDILWKGLIEDIFPYFIPFFLPEHAYLFDLNKPFEFLDKELQQITPASESETGGLRFVDKLVKVYTTGGEERWVLIHIEVQGYSDANFSQRMFNYFYRILDRYGVPVTAIAIFTDSNLVFHPNTYTYNFAGTNYNYQFNTYKVLEQNEAELAASSNPFAIAILTVLLALKRKRLDDEKLYVLKIELVRQLYARGFPRKVILHLFAFLKSYVNFSKPETEAKFDRETNQIAGNNYDMTTIEIALQLEKERSLERGKMERNQFFVESLFRNTDFTDEKIATVAGVSLEFVKEVKGKLQ